MNFMSAVKFTKEQIDELKQGPLDVECEGRNEGKIISFEEHLKAIEALEDELDSLALKQAKLESGPMVTHEELKASLGL